VIQDAMVDVRDVALAHIKAGFNPNNATGRHIVSAEHMALLEMGALLRSHFGDRSPFPRKVSPKPLVWALAPFLGITMKFVSKDDTESVKFIKKIYRKLFEIELDSWSTDQNTWLQKRD
jgi:nucleoside-diphosphate-sugar epimerase